MEGSGVTMARKPLTQLRGRVRDGQAELSFYKSTPAFADPARREAWELRIDRLSLPDFEFNNDYAEFFDGLSRYVEVEFRDRFGELIHERLCC